MVAIRLLLNGRLGLTGSFSGGPRASAVFGFTLVWSGISDPAVIRAGLLFEQSYLVPFFAAALGVAFVGTQILRLMHPAPC